ARAPRSPGLQSALLRHAALHRLRPSRGGRPPQRATATAGAPRGPVSDGYWAGRTCSKTVPPWRSQPTCPSTRFRFAPDARPYPPRLLESDWFGYIPPAWYGRPARFSAAMYLNTLSLTFSPQTSAQLPAPWFAATIGRFWHQR